MSGVEGLRTSGIRCRIFEPVHLVELPDMTLPDKDVPILSPAIEAGATHLITGDVTHFGRYYERTARGVLIVSPASSAVDFAGGLI